MSNLYHLISDGEFHSLEFLSSQLGVSNAGAVAHRLKHHIEPYDLTIQTVRLPKHKKKSLIMVAKGEEL